MDVAKGTVKVTVISAQDLSKKQLEDVSAGIKKTFGQNKVSFFTN